MVLCRPLGRETRFERLVEETCTGTRINATRGSNTAKGGIRARTTHRMGCVLGPSTKYSNKDADTRETNKHKERERERERKDHVRSLPTAQCVCVRSGSRTVQFAVIPCETSLLLELLEWCGSTSTESHVDEPDGSCTSFGRRATFEAMEESETSLE